MSILDFFSGGNNESADRAIAQAVGQYDAIKPPTLEELQVQYEQLRSAGQLTPEMEAAFQQAASEMRNVSTDPRLKQQQMNALSSLEGIADAGGMTLVDKANLAGIQKEIGMQERGSREAIISGMARRGQSGSGVELAAMLQNQQGSADRAASQGLNVQATAQARALEAIMQGGQLGGQIRQQEFGEQSEKAQAQDAINRFNTQNSQQVAGANVNRRNSAQEVNLGNAQDILNKNVAIRNTNQDANVKARQTVYDNQMGLANARSGVLRDKANQANQRGQAETDFWGNIINTGARVGQAYVTGGASELANKKK